MYILMNKDAPVAIFNGYPHDDNMRVLNSEKLPLLLRNNNVREFLSIRFNLYGKKYCSAIMEALKTNDPNSHVISACTVP